MSPEPTHSPTQPRRPLALVVDDEPGICDALTGVLADEGWTAISAHSGRDGIAKFLMFRPDLIFLDIWMPGMDGIETLQSLNNVRGRVPVVVMSGHGTIDTAVKVTKLGALEFLEKPLSLDRVLPLLERLKATAAHNNPPPLGSSASITDILGISRAMSDIRRQVQIVAPRPSWVLITGENGVGKEVVSRTIHALSPRASEPFVAVNCAAIPEELIESELFGHTRGAFTGALTARKGKFQLADRGTLFLDEIGDMSLKTQAKVLRILQEQKFEPVGDSTTISIDVRVIAATNKNMAEEIRAGRFREDLYYRLNVIPFHIPPLRERREDIRVLAEHFLDATARQLGEGRKSLSPDVANALTAYAWPGNVRELKNMIERLCIMSASPEIGLDDLPDVIRQAISTIPTLDDPSQANAPLSLREARFAFERSFILDKLEENQWNVSRTAESIGIERSNLHRKIRSLQIDSRNLKG